MQRDVPTRHVWTIAAALAILVGLVACGGAAPATDPPAAAPPPSGVTGGGGTAAPATPATGDDGTLTGGFLLAMEESGEGFFVRVVNAEAVSTLAEIVAGRLAFASVAGPVLVNGPGAPAYYDPWRWHIDPQRAAVNRVPPAGVAYYGSPSRVEADLAALVASGREKVAALPAARIVAIYDLRGTVGGPTQPPEIPLPR